MKPVQDRTGRDIGQAFQHDLQGVFKALKADYGFAWRRLTDTGAAGNMVEGQPSDYLVTARGHLAYCEAKASTTSKKFRPSMLQPAQRQAILQEGGMLDIPYYIVFYSEITGTVDVIDGTDVLKDGFSKQYPTLAQAAKADLKEELRAVWFLPSKASTLETFRSRYPAASC